MVRTSRELPFQKPAQEFPVLDVKRKKPSHGCCGCQTNWASLLSTEGTNGEHGIEASEPEPPVNKLEQMPKWRQLSLAVLQFGSL